MNPKTILALSVPLSFGLIFIGIIIAEGDRQLSEGALAAVAAILGAVVNGIFNDSNKDDKDSSDD